MGNQGGIRSAALLGFDLAPAAFVATTTAIGLFVDAARLPVYLATEHHAVAGQWPIWTVAGAGVLIGTVAGARLLRRLSPRTFKRIVSALILLLGVAILAFSARLSR